TWETPFTRAGNVRGDYGIRLGLSHSSLLPAGELRLPVEIGCVLRRASIGFTDYFDKVVFTDVQFPVIFHEQISRRTGLELVELWIPSYTLSMTSTSPGAGTVIYTDALRTRFNMGF